MQVEKLLGFYYVVQQTTSSVPLSPFAHFLVLLFFGGNLGNVGWLYLPYRLFTCTPRVACTRRGPRGPPDEDHRRGPPMGTPMRPLRRPHTRRSCMPKESSTEEPFTLSIELPLFYRAPTPAPALRLGHCEGLLSVWAIAPDDADTPLMEHSGSSDLSKNRNFQHPSLSQAMSAVTADDMPMANPVVNRNCTVMTTRDDRQSDSRKPGSKMDSDEAACSRQVPAYWGCSGSFKKTFLKSSIPTGSFLLVHDHRKFPGSYSVPPIVLSQTPLPFQSPSFPEIRWWCEQSVCTSHLKPSHVILMRGRSMYCGLDVHLGSLMSFRRPWLSGEGYIRR